MAWTTITYEWMVPRPLTGAHVQASDAHHGHAAPGGYRKRRQSAHWRITSRPARAASKYPCHSESVSGTIKAMPR